MWNTKEPPTDMETILNDTVTAQELEVRKFHNFSLLQHKATV